MKLDLDGRVVLITGGAEGLGLIAARRFAHQGALVAVADLLPDVVAGAATSLGDQHMGVAGDVTQRIDAERLVAEVLQHYGTIDILINSAGISDSFLPTPKPNISALRRLNEVHLYGTYFVSKAVAAGMRKRQRGAIINLNSAAGTLGLPSLAAPAEVKAGIGSITRAWACKWGTDNVRVNAIELSYMMTPLLEGLIDEGKVNGDRIRRGVPMSIPCNNCKS